jgi:hypothetical protein
MGYSSAVRMRVPLSSAASMCADPEFAWWRASSNIRGRYPSTTSRARGTGKVGHIRIAQRTGAKYARGSPLVRSKSIIDGCSSSETSTSSVRDVPSAVRLSSSADSSGFAQVFCAMSRRRTTCRSARRTLEAKSIGPLATRWPGVSDSLRSTSTQQRSVLTETRIRPKHFQSRSHAGKIEA